jgi:hypothetical protein
VSAGFVPERLESAYGSRINGGFAVFLTLRPAAMMVHADHMRPQPAVLTTIENGEHVMNHQHYRHLAIIDAVVVRLDVRLDVARDGNAVVHLD